MGNYLTAGAKLLLCGILTFGAVNMVTGISPDSSAIAAPGGGPGGPGGPGEGGNNGNDNGRGNGAAASAAGSLNSAHASANARAHASSTSRVGLIAEFEILAQELLGLQAEYDALQAALETATAANPTAEEIAAAEATLRDAGLIGPGETLADVNIGELNAAIGAAEIEVGVAMGEAATVQQALTEALEPAANKEVTPSVVNSVLGWLGISN